MNLEIKAPKTYILRRKGRLLVIVLALVLMLLAAFSPAVLGIGMMALEESRTGVVQNEGNSVWGVLPWLSMFTMAIFLPAVGLTVLVTVLVMVRDAVVLWRAQ